MNGLSLSLEATKTKATGSCEDLCVLEQTVKSLTEQQQLASYWNLNVLSMAKGRCGYDAGFSIQLLKLTAYLPHGLLLYGLMNHSRSNIQSWCSSRNPGGGIQLYLSTGQIPCEAIAAFTSPSDTCWPTRTLNVKTEGAY